MDSHVVGMSSKDKVQLEQCSEVVLMKLKGKIMDGYYFG